MLEGERPGDSFLFRCGEGSVSGGEEGSDVVYRGGGVEVGAQETFWVGGTVRGGEAIHVVTAGGRRASVRGPRGTDLATHRNDAISTPSTISVGLLRGLAY
jgi:hypothetical protein